MAGDWIKMESATPDKPEVWSLAEALNIDPDAVVGKLFRVWVWFDSHTEKGNAPSVTKLLLDRLVGVNCFCDAVIAVGWMQEENGELVLTNFDRHNGETAKTRALTAKRAAKHRNEKVTQLPLETALPREEKRRYKRNSANAAAFDEFWNTYPKKRNKAQAAKAFEKLNPTPGLLADILLGVERAKRTEDWQKQDGQFIPYPATWINAQGWLDELPEDHADSFVPGKPNARVA